MSKYVTKEGKQLLLNTIHSLESQNKIFEQNLMWKSYGQKHRNETQPDQHSYRKRKRDLSFDEHCSTESCSNTRCERNYWMRKLARQEEKQSDRWGHNGYKELYPEEFAENSSSSESEVSDADLSKSNNKKKKSKRKKKSKKKKSKKHKRTKK